MASETIGLAEVARAAHTLTPTEESLRNTWREVFDNPAISADDDFYELDGYSLLAARIALRVREAFGVELPLDEIYQTPTVREVAAYIDRQMATQPRNLLDSASLVLFKAGSAGLPLFFIHAPHGRSGHYLRLAQQMEVNRPMYGIDSANLKSDQPMHCSFWEMAAFCINEMRKVQPQGPYSLVGYSWSGLVAFEMAQQLRASGEEVALLAVLDSSWWYDPSALPPVRFIQQRFGIQVRRFARRVLRYLGKVRRRVMARGVVTPSAPANSQQPLIPGEDDLLRAQRLKVVRQATKKYHPIPYAGRIAYFQGKMDRIPLMGYYQQRAWSFLAQGGIEIQQVPGAHVSMMTEPLLATTAAALAEYVRNQSTPTNGR